MSKNELNFTFLKPEFSQQEQKDIDSLSFNLQNFESL